MNLSDIAKLEGGFYSFDNGHLMIWGDSANPEDRPHWERREQWAGQFGEARADWMVRRIRNLCLYPNVYLMDTLSSQIRQYRPIAVDKTEVTTYCIAPKGESTEARARRIRQYEDFYNASGMATPDDLEEFRGCQMSYRGRSARWNDLSRGAKHWIRGPNAVAEAIGLNPLMSGARIEDEGLFLVQHKYWQEAMRRALAAEKNFKE
jgi:benzoate/toluate 1,2-dioxygenase alpha subunit